MHLKKNTPEAKCFFVVLGKRKESYRGFPVIPIEDFLLEIIPQNPIFEFDFDKF